MEYGVTTEEVQQLLLYVFMVQPCHFTVRSAQTVQSCAEQAMMISKHVCMDSCVSFMFAE